MTPREKALEIIRDNPGIGRNALRELVGINNNVFCTMVNGMKASGQIVITGTKYKQHLFLPGQSTVIPPILPEYTHISDDPIQALRQALRHHPELEDYLGTDNPRAQFEGRRNGIWLN